MKLAWLIPVACLSSVAAAQSRFDPVFSLDVRPTVMQASGSASSFRWYDRDGRASLATMRLTLQNGNVITLSQKFQKVDSAFEDNSLDEVSLERKGEWKIGQQYLPFGGNVLLRDNAIGASLYTRILIDDLPLHIGAGNAGSGKMRGISGRIGRNFGLSFAVGNHIGAQPTSLTPIQAPESALGNGRGYRLALGADGFWSVGGGTVFGEYVALRDGDSLQDRDLDLSDFSSVYRVKLAAGLPDSRLTIGWARNWTESEDFLRAALEIPIDRRITVTPYIRTRKSAPSEIGISSRIKL